MSSLTLDKPAERFNHLVGLFFDGRLTDDEDRELVALCEADPSMGRRFLDQARMERALAGISGGLVPEDEFLAAVERSVALVQDRENTRRFTEKVVKRVSSISVRRVSRRQRASVRAQRSDGAWVPATLMAVAAVLVLAVLAGTEGGRDDGAAAARSKTGSSDVPDPAYLPKPKHNQSPEEPEARTPEDAVATQEMPHAPPEQYEVEEIIEEAPRELAVAPRTTVVAQDSNVSEDPAPAVKPPAPPAVKAGSLTSLANATASLRQSGGDAGELAAGGTFMSGDRITVAGNAAAEDAGAILSLAGGGTLKVRSDSVVRFDARDGSAVPVLERGAFLLELASASVENAVVLAAAEGPDVATLGSVCRVERNEEQRKVTVIVVSGRAVVHSGDTKRIVVSNQACATPFGGTPGRPYIHDLLKATGFVPPTEGSNAGDGGGAGATGSGSGSGSGKNVVGAGGDTGSNAGGTGAGNGNGSGNAGGSGSGGSGVGVPSLTQGVALGGDVEPPHGHRVAARLLVAERVDDPAAELQVLRRADAVQVLHRQGEGERLSPALDQQLHGAAHVVVQRGLQRHEGRHQLAVDPHQHVAGAQRPVPGAARHGLRHDQHARALGGGLPGSALRGLAQAQAAQLVKGRVAQHGLERAPGHRLPGLD